MARTRIEEMSDEEVASYLERAEARATGAPSEAQRAGGAPIEYSLLALACALAGMFASAKLLLAERALLASPGQELTCDFNGLVGCSDFLNSSWNTAIGDVPNALWGLMFFSGMAGLALALVSGARPARWLWRLVCLAMCGAVAYLLWFWRVSFFVKGSLCPYCLLTWAAAVPIVAHTWIRCAQAGHLPCPPGLRGPLVRWRWGIVLAVFLAVATVGAVALREKIALFV